MSAPVREPLRWRPRSYLLLGAAAALLDPLWDQSLVGAGHPAQLGHGLPSRLVLRTLVLGRAEREPGDLGQQIAPVPGDLSQLCRSGGFLGCDQAAPPGVPEGNARQASAEQPAAAGPVMILSHPARIIHRPR